MIISLIFALSISLVFPAYSDGVDVLVIANSSVEVDSVSSKFLKKVYLGKSKKWEDGEKLVPVSLKKGEVHTNFIKEVVKKSISQFNTYWKKKIFTGKGTPPKSFDTEAELVKYIKNTPGSLGYISSTTPHDGVKVLNIK